MPKVSSRYPGCRRHVFAAGFGGGICRIGAASHRHRRERNRVSLPLKLASVSEEVTVEAEADTSIASQKAPVKALLDMASPRSEISSHYIREYTSPVTDFADIRKRLRAS